MQVLNPAPPPAEEECIKLHKEISERLNTYQKVNRKLGWQVEEINEKVNEEILARDRIVEKYNNIFTRLEKKLTDMENNKRQTTKMKEDQMREKKQNMMAQIKGRFQDGVDYMHDKWETIKELVANSEEYIDRIAHQQSKRNEGKKIVENEYQNRMFREQYEHKKRIQELHQKGEKFLGEYKQPEINQQPPDRILEKERMMDDIQNK